ncbi:GTPase-associated protein 1-related protein [Catenuloplanes atrovinosus]|uniref:Uncharacterized protein n=1 Tax=Catenuloplanes atrovinosus TaxID=137266 RepID=A0AAE3YVG2_9ACTN|nr:GTPase-associated protein 1-related protein [Catenuloplanes atrovinosus]MDR7279114.1 hypothetical protein [Catenuloplanes atrovinosus]
MGVPQMYYTSCENGLAGYPGFQFNAATPGIGDAVLRRVEQDTSYEPPRSLGYQPTEAQIDDCPVNLCYLPGGGGEPAILARTVFVGTDYSQRYGNYFTHALAVRSTERDLGGALPIEFWRAAFWARDEAAGTGLPELDPVPTGSFGRAAADAFLHSSGRMGWLPRLLTAVERAIVAGERSVVLVAPDSEQVARWIATVCHLLPPSMSRELSFATYSYRPGRSRQHLVGTVPETEFTVDDNTLRGHFLFDVVGGHASELPTHPLAELLAAAGAEGARTVWSLAEPFTTGAERTFDDWYAPAVAGTIRGGLPVSDEDLQAAIRLIENGGARLRPDLVADLADHCLDHDAITVAHCHALAEAASAAGDDGLRAAAETRAFDVLVAAPAGAGPVPRPRTPAGQRHAARVLTAGLARATDGRAALPLLAVAVDARIDISAGDLERYARELLAPMVLSDPGTDPDGRLTRLLRDLPDLRRGLFGALADALPGREPAVVAAAARLVSTAPDEELRTYPRLRRVLLLARSADAPETRVPTLLRLCETEVPDDVLLTALWPDGWGLGDAAGIIAEAPSDAWESDAMVERVDQLLRRSEMPGPEEWAAYTAVCRFATGETLSGRLSMAADRLAVSYTRARHLARRGSREHGTELAGVVRAALRLHDDADPITRRYLTNNVYTMLLRLEPKALAELLPRTPEPIRDRFTDRAATMLRDRAPDQSLAAALFEARMLLAKREPRITAEIDRLLADTVARWRSRDLEGLEKWLAGGPKGAVAYYAGWREANVRRGIGRLFPRWRP